jgi:hypothetical protein
MTTTPHSSDDLFHALAARARATSDGRLVLAVIGGLAAAIGAAVWRSSGWVVIASIGTCAAAVGGWGIADRELGERATRNGSVAVLRAVRVICIVLGTCAALVVALTVLGTALGTWIS